VYMREVRNMYKVVRFQILMVVGMNMSVLWVVVLCNRIVPKMAVSSSMSAGLCG
jgi:hypothetical protein